MVLNKAGQPHGFRNDGVEPVLMSISVGTGMPKPPVYVCHPRDSDPEAARRFGAALGNTCVFDPDSGDPRQQEFARHILRYAERRPVWDAGFARLAYVGEGGVPPGQYRMDMVHLPKGAGVRGYSRPVEDAYFVIEGCITVGWEASGYQVEERLGPKDMVLNQVGRPHGFRNDGVEPVLMSISVGSGMPKPPVYVCHPRDSDPAVARHFGAGRGRTYALDPDSDDPRQREFARHIVRCGERRPSWHAGFARSVYIGEGGAPPGKYRMDMIQLPRGVAVRGYTRPVEDVYFVMEGYITAGWEEAGRVAEEGLGPKDAIFNPSGRVHYFRNDAVSDATFMMLVGTAEAEDVRFHAA